MLIPCLLALLISPADSPIEVRTGEQPGRVQFAVAIDAVMSDGARNGTVSTRRGESLLRVSLRTETQQPGPAIFGSYRYTDGKLQFKPRFGLVPGQIYLITYTPRPGSRFQKEYRVPVHFVRPPPTVTAVYPSAERLPANHLKFYIHFSQPMREGREIFSEIQLLDARAKPLRGPWRRTELWNADATRFTLWIHPGRIKRGVNLRDDEGPVLVPGQRYTLRIPVTLRGADSQPLQRSHLKNFRVITADSQRPDPARWELSPPTVGTREPLRLSFQEPLDHALTLRCLRVRDSMDNRIKGTVTLAANETTWQFVPNGPWKGSSYQVSISRYLEDLAGNTPDRIFDTDLQSTAPAAISRSLDFRPRP